MSVVFYSYVTFSCDPSLQYEQDPRKYHLELWPTCCAPISAQSLYQFKPSQSSVNKENKKHTNIYHLFLRSESFILSAIFLSCGIFVTVCFDVFPHL